MKIKASLQNVTRLKDQIKIMNNFMTKYETFDEMDKCLQTCTQVTKTDKIIKFKNLNNIKIIVN